MTAAAKLAVVTTDTPSVNGSAPAQQPTARSFFTDNGKFIPRQLAEQLRDETPVAVGGETLFTYLDGVYRPGGEASLRSRIADYLADQWRRSSADEVIAYLRDSSPRLWERPPLNIVNCRNGLLDVTNRQLKPHTPDHLSPIQIAAAFDPAATCSAIDSFIRDTFPPDAHGVAYQIAGYLLVPDNSLQTAVMLLGGGANGKSTFTQLVTRLLGDDNVAAIPLHRLDEDRFACAELYGRLANVFADLDARALRSSSIFKSITGGDTLAAERKFRPAFSFVPYARLLFSANTPPPTSDSSDAFFRRWLIVPFDRTFAPGERDPRVLDRLTTPAELSGLLNRALPALETVRRTGRFVATPSTDRAAERFRIDSDSVAGYVDECCRLDPAAETTRKALFAGYRDWCQANGRQPLAAQRFYERLRAPALGLAETATRGVRKFRGLELPSADR